MFKLQYILQNDLFNRISDSFSKTPNEFRFVVIGIITLITILIIIGIITAVRSKRLIIAGLFTKYKTQLAVFKINNNEKNLLDTMSAFLINPGKRYLLLTDPNIFHTALNKLREKKHIDGILLHSLEKKLGFQDFSPYVILKSTYDITNGTLVIIVFSSRRKITGHIIKSEDMVKVLVDDKNYIFRTGLRAILITHNYTGIFAFYTRLKFYSDGIMYFDHSSRGRIYQRREFYRSKKIRSVTVQRNQIDMEIPVDAKILDLSGGGACLDNSNLQFEVNDKFEIHFPRKGKNALIINADVVRVSHNKKVIHVKFNNLIPILQDQIIQIVNS